MALVDILDMEKRLSEDFDPKKELQEARAENMIILVDTNIILDALMKSCRKSVQLERSAIPRTGIKATYINLIQAG